MELRELIGVDQGKPLAGLADLLMKRSSGTGHFIVHHYTYNDSEVSVAVSHRNTEFDSGTRISGGCVRVLSGTLHLQHDDGDRILRAGQSALLGEGWTRITSSVPNTWYVTGRMLYSDMSAFVDALLKSLVPNLPVRQLYRTVSVGGGVARVLYLNRFFLHEEEDGTQHWLHQFLAEDESDTVHTHPAAAVCHLLNGGYKEKRLDGDREYVAGDTNILSVVEPHAIHDVVQGTWTYVKMLASDNKSWFFQNLKTGERQERVSRSQGVEWWKDVGTLNNPLPQSVTEEDSSPDIAKGIPVIENTENEILVYRYIALFAVVISIVFLTSGLSVLRGILFITVGMSVFGVWLWVCALRRKRGEDNGE